MDRHQRHLVVGVAVFRDVHVAQQRDVLEKVVQGEHAHHSPFVRVVFRLLFPLLDELRHRVEQLVQVGRTGQPLDGGILLVEGVQAALVRDPLRQLVGVRDRHEAGQAFDHLAEGLHLGHFARRLEQRNPLLLGDGLHGPQGLVADAAGGLVHHPAERFVVAGIDHQLEIGHHVLDLRPVEEGVAGVDHIGDVAPAELLLQRAGLRIGAVEDGEILVLRPPGTHPLQDVGDDHHRLLLLRIGLDHVEALPRFAHGIAVLGDAPLVVGDHGIGRVHDGLRGPVVPFEAEEPAFRVVLFEIQDVLDARPAEGVDGLAVVAHHADVPVELREFLEDEVLGGVGVLVLVHQDVREAARDGLQRPAVVPQQDVHVQ